MRYQLTFYSVDWLSIHLRSAFDPRPVHVRFMMAKAALDIFPRVLRFSPISYHLTTAPYSSSFNTTLYQKAKKAEDLMPWSRKYFFFFKRSALCCSLQESSPLLGITRNAILMVTWQSQQPSSVLTRIIKWCHVLPVKGKRKVLEHNYRRNQPPNDVYRAETSALKLSVVLKSYRVTTHEISSNF